MVYRYRNLITALLIISVILIQISTAVAKETSIPAKPPKKPSPFTPAKSKWIIPPPPAMPSEIYSAILTAAQITVQFNVPKSVSPKENLQIQYELTGIGQAAVEATAFENPAYLSKWVYTTSAFPKDIDVIFNYLGAVPANKSGTYSKKFIPKLTDRFSANNYTLIFFEIRNFGKTMLKSQGYGQVKYILKLVNPTMPNSDPYIASRFSPKPDFELYPGDRQEVAYLIRPLPVGTYLLKMIAIWNDNTPIAETDLAITVVKDNRPELGTVIPETIPLLRPPLFSKETPELQEPLHTFRVYELSEPNKFKCSGILALPMEGKSRTVILRLITPSGLATTSVSVVVEKRKRERR
ncbi:MAG: hypothetical protein ACE14V_00540 [bacterium]